MVQIRTWEILQTCNLIGYFIADFFRQKMWVYDNSAVEHPKANTRG
jgi:hypothetical protein